MVLLFLSFNPFCSFVNLTMYDKQYVIGRSGKLTQESVIMVHKKPVDGFN